MVEIASLNGSPTTHRARVLAVPATLFNVKRDVQQDRVNESEPMKLPEIELESLTCSVLFLEPKPRMAK